MRGRRKSRSGRNTQKSEIGWGPSNSALMVSQPISQVKDIESGQHLRMLIDFRWRYDNYWKGFDISIDQE